jgi:outer membrane lipoprotein-sorting protein
MIARNAGISSRRNTVGWCATIILFYSLCIPYCAAAPATQPASAISSTPPAGVDPALWARMIDIDARAGKITSLIADFQQQKFTALLKKPLVSSGTVRVKGATMRWDTRQPQPSVLFVNDQEVRIFYPVPAPGIIEVYNLDQRVGELAASPLPRLAVLKEKFSFEQIPAGLMDSTVDPKAFLGLKMLPIEPSLKEHVNEVRVLLDASAGYILRAEMTDADGDKTLLHFTHVRINADPGEMELKTPAGVKVTRPLEGLQGQAPRNPSK